jgi:para-aminobenzoate synthetase component 1
VSRQVYAPTIVEVPAPPSPREAFALIAARPGAVLLESGTRDPRLGRWSFLACDPFLTFHSKGRRIEITAGGTSTVRQGDPFAALQDLLAEVRVERPAGAPPLIAGAVGYFGYDLGRFVERIPERTVDDAPIADCHLGFYGAVLAIDHTSSRARVSAIGAPETDPAVAGQVARQRAEELAQAVQGRSPLASSLSPSTSPRPKGGVLPLASGFTREGYLRAVRRAKEYIAAGDIYQVNLSQRLHARLATDAFSLYQRLQESNPAPFAAYFTTPEAAIVSCSPERFLEVRGREVETRPIKGTRPRGATPEEDARLAAELLASEKDRAENVMIVDLERNDLGRACEFGSVHVPELFAVESYATVHHLVSTVRGRLRPEMTALDCLRASFPGGSITGAPKVRSMEIIEELEPTRRGVYTGAIGYLCFSGDMDVNIVIRTLVVKGETAYFQVGGGIVADSDPEAEYQETIDKGQALAAGLAAEAGAEEIEWPK